MSYVLNNKNVVRRETRERVLQVIEQLNFRPNAVARGLLSKRLNTLGVVLPSNVRSPILHPYYAPVLDGIMAVALRMEQNTTLFTGHTWINARESLPVFRDGRVDGLLLICPPIGLDLIPALTTAGMPFVLIDCQYEDPRVNEVTIDDVLAAKLMTHYLFDLGHRRIAFICGASHSPYVGLRVKGFQRAHDDANIAFDRASVLEGDYTRESLESRIHFVASLPASARPTAIMVANDEMALDAMKILQSMGLRVPEEISVTGFDDNLGASSAHPPLTTIRQPLRDIGSRATEILLDVIANDEASPRKETMPIELIVRESTAPPARG